MERKYLTEDTSEVDEAFITTSMSTMSIVSSSSSLFSYDNLSRSSTNLKPGYAYILNHVKFDDPRRKERNIGSAKDVKTLVDTFKYFEMEVTVIENASMDDIKKFVQKIKSQNFRENACLVVAIMSHGKRHENIAAKDGFYSVDDEILFPILENSTLNDKPKIFFIQACKGSKRSCRDAVPSSSHSIPSDVLKCYSTFEGFIAYRHEDGSIFISVLCDLLQKDGWKTDIKEIMDSVIKDVKEKSKNTQIPSYTSTLTKPFIFGDYVKWAK